VTVRPWLGFSIGLGACLTASPAAAEGASDHVSISWSAPAECPPRSRLEAEVSALLGRGVPSSGQQNLAVFVSVQGDAGRGYAAKLSFSSARGNEVRYLEHADCGQLVHAFALVIALAIDPEGVHVAQSTAQASADGQPEPRQTPPSEATAVPVAAVRSKPAMVPERNQEPAAAHAPLHGARVALHALVGTGPLPGVGAGLQAALGYHRRQARIEVLGRYWHSREVQSVEPPALTLELGLATLGVRACWQPLAGAWQLSACAGGDLGQLHGSGSGVETAHENRARYSQLAAGLRAAYTRWLLAPELGFELSVPLERPAFGFLRDGQEDALFRPANFGFSAFFGVALEP
jgi:hypothetical protein